MFYDLYAQDDVWVLNPRMKDGAKFGQPMYSYDVWSFSRCERAVDIPIPVPFEIARLNEGPVDFNEAVHGEIIVSGRCADVIRDTLDERTYQFVPARIEESSDRWEVLNILDRVDCLDHRQSKIRYNDDDHPDKPGKPRSVERMILDPQRAEGHDLFRLQDWEVAVVASDRLKSIFERAGINGIEYWPVVS